MVSSAKPKVVPPIAISVVTKIIKTYSFPFNACANQEIPASKAPVEFTIPIRPPIINTKSIISDTSNMPFKGDLINANNPWGRGFSFWYVPGILIGFQISPVVNFSNGILTSNLFKVS